MGLLDDAKDKLGDAAGWVKDKAEHLGEQAQGAGQSLGEKAADARHWVGSRVGGDAEPGSASETDPADGSHVGGGGTFEVSPAGSAEPVPSPAEEWVEVTSDGSTVDADDASGSGAAGSDDAASHGAASDDGEPEQDRSI